ncbi:MAG: thiamine diphosphokinase [Deltaproteobacteria bacterium]|nr:thiamine diphosphokinase [Deltaproteobacteria bacterium]
MSENHHVVIVSGGRLGKMDFFSETVAKIADRLLIVCDGGARHLARSGLMPDVLLGDMDSINPEQLAKYEKAGVRVIRYPVNKDYTDTALALDYALSLKPRSIDIWGTQGGRIDHTLANLFLLIKAREAGIETRLMDEYMEAFVPAGDVLFTGASGCLVSLIALSPRVEGITLDGFLYPLCNGTLTMSESRGVSNIIAGDRAGIRVRSGNLLVIRYRQKDVFPEVT